MSIWKRILWSTNPSRPPLETRIASMWVSRWVLGGNHFSQKPGVWTRLHRACSKKPGKESVQTVYRAPVESEAQRWHDAGSGRRYVQP